jgi:phage major head subunit gpT-like protein
MLITTTSLIEINRQFQMKFDQAFRDRPVYWDKKAERIDTSSEVNVYAWLAEMPDWREWIGPRLMRNLVARDYKLKNKDWEFSFAVPRNDIFYDKLGIWSKRATLAGAGAKRLYDKIITDAQLAGTTTKCWDGQYFYDTDHPVVFDDAGAGTYSNYRVSTPLTLDNFNAMWDAMAGFTGENGLSLEIVPDILEVPPGLRTKARNILNSELRVQVVQNVAADQNVAAAAVDNIIAGDVSLIVNPKLTSGEWYLHSTSILKPFILQVAKDPTPLLAKDAPTDDNVFHRKEFEYGSDAIAVGGYGLPFLSMRMKEGA